MMEPRGKPNLELLQSLPALHVHPVVVPTQPSCLDTKDQSTWIVELPVCSEPPTKNPKSVFAFSNSGNGDEEKYS